MTTKLQLFSTDQSGRPIPLDTSNPKAFQSVVTLCPLNAITGDYPDLLDKKNLQAQLEQKFQKNNLNWHFVGRTLTDDPTGWNTLVHDCSFPNSELAKQNLDVRDGMKENDFKQLQKQKEDRVRAIKTEKWFEPVFKELDKAVFGGEKTLVHCQAGQSRSATLLAAYLINRFGVASEKAIAFLRSKRFCVDPKFSTKLKEYHQSLNKREA